MKRFKPALRMLLKDQPPMYFFGMELPTSLKLPKGALMISASKLLHAPSIGVPLWYSDRPFECRDCGVVEVWTAAQQKYYCEEQKGDPSAKAIRCRACREKLNREKRARRETQEANRERKLHAKNVK